MAPEEDRHPVRAQLEGFLDGCRSGTRPKADLETGLRTSTAVILANLAMDEGRRVQFAEMEKLGRPCAPAPAPTGRPSGIYSNDAAPLGAGANRGGGEHGTPA